MARACKLHKHQFQPQPWVIGDFEGNFTQGSKGLRTYTKSVTADDPSVYSVGYMFW
ncbi:hypothetical protein CANTEDRAFT_116530 [Yamadazyma tenuis ATCC 10573]|uniref:Uncharacterized protein n=1 Tax=Candida tenuis (strain ATCC 10573 / BCRC 21748 / CBS 615 / JCM 9827 / NBRC 10315 / NRRL Y-1498 / VKM Y-70) TaxID=590646 RepID=G3BE77_CANTC|nr:uncharacterized protein CANTEDRAFT_116530 [Yamadazyma tenuis ATCC 10573]EGV60477.1 hypothetical protein CANTEDRAFT_116530 [Yamadazyma tenuis ATCC 10573]